ncbi:hypothetical protein Tco_1207710, partial [Tanacetum coccineum]
MHSNDDLVDKYDGMKKSYVKAYNQCLELEAELSKKTKNTIISNLKKRIQDLKGKSVTDCTKSVSNSKVITPGMYKLDLELLSPKLRKNREAHVDYLKQTKEHADTLREILEQARALKPVDNALDYACKFVTRIQELLVYVSATCPSSRNNSEKLVDVTPININRQVTFEKPRLNSPTNAIRLKRRKNTMNNRIQPPSSSNSKHKNVEVHLRNVKSSLNKRNHVSACNANVKHAVLNANS